MEIPRNLINFMCKPAITYFNDKCGGEDITFVKGDILLLEEEKADVGQWIYDELIGLSEKGWGLNDGYVTYRVAPDPLRAELHLEEVSSIQLGTGQYEDHELDILWEAFTWLLDHI